MKMFVTNYSLLLLVVLGVVDSSYGRRLSARDITVHDNGLGGYIDHIKDNQKAGFLQGHHIQKRSPHGSQYANYDYNNFKKKYHNHGFNDEIFSGAESRHGRNFVGYQGNFHSFLPYPPPHHGPHPGPYPPPFQTQYPNYMGYFSNDGWNTKFDSKPCHGHGCSFGPNSQGQGHAHGHAHGHAEGDSCDFPPGHAFGHGQGHGHGHGQGHGHGNGHGHGHGHGHGQGNKFDKDCDYEYPYGNGGSMESTYPSFPYPEFTTTEGIPVTRPTPPKPTPRPTTTTEPTDPTYDIDIRLGGSN